MYIYFDVVKVCLDTANFSAPNIAIIEKMCCYKATALWDNCNWLNKGAFETKY